VTIRLRLAILYGVLFVAAGATLLAVSYAIVYHQLPADKVSAVTAQDVRLRAEKLLGTTKPDDPARPQLKVIANSSDDAIRKLIGSPPSTLPKEYARSLFAELPSTVRSDALHTLVVSSLVALAAMAVIAGGLGWIVAGRILRPIDAITDAAQQLSAENLHERIALHGPNDELKRLADTFDAMLGRLEAAFEGQRRFVANASHELRTPLTIMRSEVDVALRNPDTSNDDFRSMAVVVRGTIDRADQLITSLLALAAAEHGPEVAEPLDLAVVTQHAIDLHRAGITERGITVTPDLHAAEVVGDPGLISRVADNLLDNAVAHNVDGGWMSIATGMDDATAFLVVTNGGSFVSHDDVEHLFEPFHRGDRTASNHVGIGLSIVRSVITAHGGTVVAEAQPQGGLRVTVRLPINGRLAGQRPDIARSDSATVA
jgi:signal transduction histidine kinase